MRVKEAKIVAILFAGVCGARSYLDYTSNPHVVEIGRLKDVQFGTWIVLWFVFIYTQWRIRTPTDDISPARSGVIVVVGTGFAAAVALGWRMHGLADLAPSALVVALTLVIAGLVYRFASKFQDQIGEARFMTGQQNDPEG